MSSSPQFLFVHVSVLFLLSQKERELWIVCLVWNIFSSDLDAYQKQNWYGVFICCLVILLCPWSSFNSYFMETVESCPQWSPYKLSSIFQVSPLACHAVGPYSCKRLCGRLLDCQNHTCTKECHKVTDTDSNNDVHKVSLTFLAAEQKHLALRCRKMQPAQTLLNVFGVWFS